MRFGYRTRKDYEEEKSKELAEANMTPKDVASKDMVELPTQAIEPRPLESKPIAEPKPIKIARHRENAGRGDRGDRGDRGPR